MQVSRAGEGHPKKGKRITRRETQRSLDIALHLLGATNVQFCVSDSDQSLGQIPVQRQRALGLHDALGWVIGMNFYVAQRQMGLGVVWRGRKRLRQRRFGRGEAGRPFRAGKVGGLPDVGKGATDQSLDVVRLDR